LATLGTKLGIALNLGFALGASHRLGLCLGFELCQLSPFLVYLDANLIDALT
jgi:hypothetical protein